MTKTNDDKNSDGGKKIEYLINFIGDNSHAKLTKDKVANYKLKYKEFATNLK